MEHLVIGIEGMSCNKCVLGVTGVLQALPGVQRVEVSLEGGQADIDYDAAQVGVAQIRDAIEGAGFDVV